MRNEGKPSVILLRRTPKRPAVQLRLLLGAMPVMEELCAKAASSSSKKNEFESGDCQLGVEDKTGSASIVQPGCTRRSLAKNQFKREVEKELTGRETEPWEIIYFKLYQSQIPVIEQAIETAALMLGTDKSRGYRQVVLYTTRRRPPTAFFQSVQIQVQ